MATRLAARWLRQAAHLGHATGNQGLVAGEVVANQCPLPVAQEVAGMLASPGLAEVIHHGFHVFERPWRVGPQVGAMRRSLARFEHLHWRLVGVQHTVAEYFRLERID